MVGPLFSVLLMGLLPVWGMNAGEQQAAPAVPIAPPSLQLMNDLPVLALDGRVSASGILIVDLDSAQTLYQRAAQVERPMASLTKLMTALLLVEHHALDEWVTVPEVGKVGSSAHLPAGEQFTVGDLLSALLIPSGNDAAIALARMHSGTLDAFVEEMNARAKELGLADTHFVNPTGLDAPQQVSTPRDIAWLTLFVWRHAAIAERMGMGSKLIRSRGGVPVSLLHTHTLVRDKDSQVVAGKTGTTEGARQCLLSVVEYDNHRYVVVLMHSSDRYGDMKPILAALIR